MGHIRIGQRFGDAIIDRQSLSILGVCVIERAVRTTSFEKKQLLVDEGLGGQLTCQGFIEER